MLWSLATKNPFILAHNINITQFEKHGFRLCMSLPEVLLSLGIQATERKMAATIYWALTLCKVLYIVISLAIRTIYRCCFNLQLVCYNLLLWHLAKTFLFGSYVSIVLTHSISSQSIHDRDQIFFILSPLLHLLTQLQLTVRVSHPHHCLPPLPVVFPITIFLLPICSTHF